jgi:hypothetical protein
MSYVAGSFLFVVGLAMIFFARPKSGKTAWVARIEFFGELYIVAAISIMALGICIATLS